MSNLRNIHVACHYGYFGPVLSLSFMSHVEFKKCSCHLVAKASVCVSNLKNGCVDFRGLEPSDRRQKIRTVP